MAGRYTSDSAFWPDAQDPLALKHGRVKVDELRRRVMALHWMLLKAKGHGAEADAIDSFWAKHNDIHWAEDKLRAEQEFGGILQSARSRLDSLEGVSA